MKGFILILSVVALGSAQKLHKSGKHPKSAYVATSPGDNYGGPAGPSSQYDGPSSYTPKAYHGGNHGLANSNKPQYAALLSDTRTLNQDGTINFNFQADNGLQQGETVDPDGTRRGFYSYPGADGKTITVKYTAGKNGFVAEGDHLPLQPQAAAHSDKDEQEYDGPKPKQGRPPKHDSGHYNPPKHDSGHYNPPKHDSGHYNPTSYSQGPSHYNSQPQSAPRYHGGPPRNHYQGGPPRRPSYNDGPSYSSPFPESGPGQNSFSHYSPASHSPPSRGPRPGAYSGAPSRTSHGGFTANNPYQSAGAGPYNGNFDLGNGGQFSIDFTPGAGEEYNPSSGELGGQYSPSVANFNVVGARQRPAAAFPGFTGGQRFRGGPRGQY